MRSNLTTQLTSRKPNLWYQTVTQKEMQKLIIKIGDLSTDQIQEFIYLGMTQEEKLNLSKIAAHLMKKCVGSFY